MAGVKSNVVEMKLSQAHKEYVESRASPSLVEIAHMFDLGESTVKVRASEGNWAAEREAFQSQLATAIAARDLPDMVEQTTRIKTKMYDLLETAIDRTKQGLESGQLTFSSPKAATDTIGHLWNIMREAGLANSLPAAPPSPGGEKVPSAQSAVALFINGVPGQVQGQTIDVTPKERD